MEFAIKQAEFETSAALGSVYPEKTSAEIAIVGKSNVGKSSLINSLCNNKKLARTSSSPGKTRLINFFKINRDFYLVDLPGYGFAKAPKTEKEKWGRLMEGYLSSGRVDHLFMLIDIRHEPTADDKLMLQWIIYYNIPYTLIATKSDKLARSKRVQAANTAAKLLGAP
ncbi:MAG: YihA family ribosome biogenesis GTP-binding protein, partial [Clostridia bacterium]|nr:YihA family ribosome biogenesis GTP-binding protein [Clostridia bacterium]